MNEIKIKSKSMPLSYWQEILSQTQFDAFKEIIKSDYPTEWQEFSYTANEVFYALVRYEGGAYPDYALYLIKVLYGVELD